MSSKEINPKTNKPYDETPPAANIKCIIFTLILALGYWFLPSKNKWVLLLLLYIPYLALAWYDFIYNCEHNMGPTYLALYYAWAKPKDSKQIQTYNNWHPKYKKQILIVDIVILVALLAIAPSFLRWKPKK